jgi:general secretion pathway protein L
MKKRIILFLHNSELGSWIVLSDDTIIQSSQKSPLDTLTFSKNEDIESIVIVPAQDVLLTQVVMPKLGRDRLLQALPFAMEEQLIDDVENLHFAVGPYLTDSFPVAVVAKQKMALWIDTLKKINLKPAAIFPLNFVLPYEENPQKENFWVANSYDHISTVRTGKFSGFGCDESNLDVLLDSQKKENITIVRSTDSEIKLLENNFKFIDDSPPINLLQGDFRGKRKSSQTKSIWKIAGILTAVFVGLLFLSNAISFFILYRQENIIQNDMIKIYKRNFPQATEMVSPRSKMEQKLKKVVTDQSKNNFLILLGLIGKSLSETKGIYFQHLEFRENQLTLELSASSFDDLDAFTKSLTNQGLSVNRQNAAVAGTQVKASLIVNTGAA